MCGSKGSNCSCCPNATVLQEKICGNLTGELSNFMAWQAPTVNDYFQGTFEIFNAGPGTITSNIIPTVPPGNTVSASINNPSNFIINVPAGTHGKFCITLYKRIF